MGSTSKSTAVQGLAPMLTSEGALDQSGLNMIANTPPQLLNISLPDYDKLLNTYGLLNAYKSRAAEKELTPDIANLRASSMKDMNDTYQNAIQGKLPEGVQHALMSAGLENQAATGSATGGGTRGNATLTELYGRGTNDYVNNVRAMVQQYLNGNPLPVAGLDPSSAANLRLTQTTANNALTNNWQQQLINATLGVNANANSRANSFGNAAAMQSNSNAQASNQSAGAGLGAVVGLIGAAAAAY